MWEEMDQMLLLGVLANHVSFQAQWSQQLVMGIKLHYLQKENFSVFFTLTFISLD